jgi:hypothetical protein
MRKFANPVLVVAVVLLAAACAQQQRTETAPPAETPAAEPMQTSPMPIELTPEKVTELAQLAAHMEKDPSMAADLLAQHNLTQEQLTEAMGRIMADTTMNAMYMQAKEAAMASMPTDMPPAETPAEGGAGH